MTQPTYAELRSLQTSAHSVIPESLSERILTVLSVIASGQNPDGTTFNLVTAGAGGGGPYVPVTGTYAVAATTVVTSRVTGDTNPRFEVDANGQHWWGAGNIAVDVSLRRPSAALLRCDGNFYVDGELLASAGAPYQVKIGGEGPAGEAGAIYGSGSDTNMYRVAASQLKTDGGFTIAATTAGSGAVIGTSSGAKVGFYGVAVTTQLTVTGGRTLGTALTNLLTQLQATGIIVDATTA